LQLLAEHLLLLYAPQKLSKWFTEQYILKSVQPMFSTKNPNSLHYADNVFFREAFCNIYLALLKNGHLYSCPFSPSDAISFLDFYKE
jgi:hypothetical protein